MKESTVTSLDLFAIEIENIQSECVVHCVRSIPMMGALTRWLGVIHSINKICNTFLCLN